MTESTSTDEPSVKHYLPNVTLISADGLRTGFDLGLTEKQILAALNSDRWLCIYVRPLALQVTSERARNSAALLYTSGCQYRKPLDIVLAYVEPTCAAGGMCTICNQIRDYWPHIQEFAKTFDTIKVPDL